VRSLATQADRALRHVTLYAPETEHYRQRTAPYLLLIGHGLLFACAALFAVFTLGLLAFGLRPGVPWYGPVLIALFFCGSIIWGRLRLASASWAWHTIKTGEERPPRAPQVGT
jgi:hypothetical protein